MRERPTVENGIAEFKRAMIEAGETMAKRAGEIMADLAAALEAEQSMTIVEFILARVRDDETCPACRHPIAEHVGRWCRVPTGALTAAGKERICCCEAADSTARVLAECAALRAVVELHPRHDWLPEGRDECAECGCADDRSVDWPCPTLRSLATIWVGHESYDPEWRVG